MRSAELQARFERARKNLDFIDHLPKQIKFTKLYQERIMDSMPLLSCWYEKTEENVAGLVASILMQGIEMQGLDKGKDLYSRFEKERLDILLRVEQEYKETRAPRFKGITEYLDMFYMEQTMALKCRMYNYISKVNYRESIHDLYRKAKDGDERSFLKLVKMDKTVMLNDWAKQLIKRKQYECDWRFFKRLGQKIGEEPYRGAYPLVKAEIVAEYFWEELRNWKYKDILELFQEQGLIAAEMDLSAFKMFLYRAGLKKGSKKSNKIPA